MNRLFGRVAGVVRSWVGRVQDARSSPSVRTAPSSAWSSTSWVTWLDSGTSTAGKNTFKPAAADLEFLEGAGHYQMWRYKPIILDHFQRWIQNFPRGGAPTPQGGGERQHTILPYFPENCMKSKEFGCPGGGGAPCAPLNPPLIFTKKLHEKNWIERESPASFLICQGDVISPPPQKKMLSVVKY